MLIYRRTSILESTAQTVVNTVNCVGVMGKGIAKCFKERDPAMFRAYRALCDKHLLQPGTLWLWQGSPNWILNFPTKVHWRNPSKLEWIEAGLKKFVAEYPERGIKSVSFPRLGCGNGNLDWSDVEPLMVSYLKDLPIPVFIHDFTVDIGLPEHLEAISHRLQSEDAGSSSFESFLSNMRRAAELGKEGLVDIEEKNTFHAHVDAEGNLTIVTGDRTWLIERDDLRGVWLSLLTGLVTRDKAGWSVREGGNAILSMLSVMPHVRIIQIQRPSKEPELAAELLTRSCKTSPVPEVSSQTELAWA